MKERALLTIDSDVLAQGETLDGVAEGLDVELSLEMPDKGLSIEHIAGEQGEALSVGDLEFTGQVEGATTATVDGENKEEKRKKEGMLEIGYGLWGPGDVAIRLTRLCWYQGCW